MWLRQTPAVFVHWPMPLTKTTFGTFLNCLCFPPKTASTACHRSAETEFPQSPFYCVCSCAVMQQKFAAEAANTGKQINSMLQICTHHTWACEPVVIGLLRVCALCWVATSWKGYCVLRAFAWSFCSSKRRKKSDCRFPVSDNSCSFQERKARQMHSPFAKLATVVHLSVEFTWRTDGRTRIRRLDLINHFRNVRTF